LVFQDATFIPESSKDFFLPVFSSAQANFQDFFLFSDLHRQTSGAQESHIKNFLFSDLHRQTSGAQESHIKNFLFTALHRQTSATTYFVQESHIKNQSKNQTSRTVRS
jgi:hypothetical protein